MRVILSLAALFGLASPLAFGESWKGLLVDSKCYAALQRNKNPSDTSTAVDRDRGEMVRYCGPKAKTKFFAIVGEDGRAIKLDSAGDTKAAELIKTVGKKSMLEVAVTGTRGDHTINVESISTAR